MSYLHEALNSDNAKTVTSWVTLEMRYSIAPGMPPSLDSDEEAVTVWRCPYCGWWVAKSKYLNTGGHIMGEVGYGALRAFDPADVAAPIEASRAHLMLRPEDALKLHPQRLEDIVGSSEISVIERG